MHRTDLNMVKRVKGPVLHAFLKLWLCLQCAI